MSTWYPRTCTCTCMLSTGYIQWLNCEKRSGGTLEARRRVERRKRENRGAVGAQGGGEWEGVSPSPTD